MEQHIPSTWRRLGARLLDMFFMSLVASPFLASAYEDDGWLVLSIPMAAIVALAPFLYEALFYYFVKTTPGKWIFSLRVVPAEWNSRDSWLVRCFLRSAVGYLWLFFSWAIYATAFFRYDRRHWGDLWAGTRVVGAHEVGRNKRRPFLALLLMFLGFDSGWNGAVQTIQSVQFRNNSVRIPQPEGFEITFEEDEE